MSTGVATTQRRIHSTVNAGPSKLATAPPAPPSPVRHVAQFVAGSPAAAAHAFGKMQRATGITTAVFMRAGVSADLEPQEALAALQRKVGGRVWRRALACGSGVAVSTALLSAINGDAPKAPPAPMPPCAEDEEDDPRSKFCGSCNSMNRESAKHCTSCGKMLAGDDDADHEGDDDVPNSDPKPAPGSKSARIERAKKDPTVLKMFNQPNNTHSLDAIAEQFVRAQDEQ